MRSFNARLIELVKIGGELRQARSRLAAEQAFNCYVPNPIDDARTARITTLAVDALTAQPVWVIDHVRFLNDHHLLVGADAAAIATRIITTAAHLDLHGGLPASWPALPPLAIDHAQPGIEVG